MSHLLKYKLIPFFLILFLLSCGDNNWDNPNDANSNIDPSDWAPDNLQAQVLTDSEIKLTWTQKDKRIDGFIIERNTDGGEFTQITEISVNVLEYTDTGLEFGPTYIYKVKAFTFNNESSNAYSNAISTSFPAPTSLIVTITNDSVIYLDWVDNCNFEKGFRLERSEESGSFIQIAEIDEDVIQYTDTVLTNDTWYSYRILAFTELNQSDHSNIVTSYYGKTLTDIDGNVYQIVKIGDQIWMKENLKVTKYSNGDPIVTGYTNYEWSGLSTGAYAIYNHDNNNSDNYGLLYNWYAVNDNRNISPEKWHVPTDDEWKQLEIYLGMSQSEVDKNGNWRGTNEGGELKETGTDHWKDPNVGATNGSNFTALPGGYRDDTIGNYDALGSSGYFWLSTESNSDVAWTRKLSSSTGKVGRYNFFRKENGLSVRCIRN